MLPDRVTVPTCIACGAMGRAARCEGDCSELRLPLVDAADLDALGAACRSARARVGLLEPVARALADETPSEPACPDAYGAVRDAARAALARLEPWDLERDWATPDTVTGWWCPQCGNVDAPQPCLGVCVWRDVEWVNAALYIAEHARCSDELRAAPALTMVLSRVVAVTPRQGRCADTWKAFRSQALTALGSRAS